MKQRPDKGKRDFARQLRRRATDAERLLWWQLRNRHASGCKFRRQYPVGAYIADFACLKHRLIIELDGGQHAECRAYDKERDAWFEQQGFTVLRFWDNYVLTHLDGTMETIWRALADRNPSAPRGRGQGLP